MPHTSTVGVGTISLSSSTLGHYFPVRCQLIFGEHSSFIDSNYIMTGIILLFRTIRVTEEDTQGQHSIR